MAARTDALPGTVPSAEERLYIASQWKLVWWRFIRHRLAVASAIVLGLFYLVALFPEFLAIHDPQDAFAKRAFVPPQRVHFFNGLVPTRPFVNDLSGRRNPVTLAMEYTPDPESKIPIKFFVRGFEYKFLNIIDTNIGTTSPLSFK